MRILVTGANGFIGTHLVRALLANSKHEVFALGRSAQRMDTSATSVVVVDLASRAWTNVLPEGIDVVVHLAQSRSFRTFPEAAEDVLRINVDATFEVLEWSRRNHVKGFVYTSTGSVYEPQPRPLSEDDRVQPSSFYASSKVAGEALCSAYSGFFATTILRLFSVYGPGTSDSVIPRLMRRIANGESIELDGGLGMLTTPTYVTDCVDAILRIVMRTPEPAMLRVLNLCGDEEVSLRDVCAKVGQMLGREAKLLANDRTPLHLSGTSERAKVLLQWQPQVSMHDGLTALVAAS